MDLATALLKAEKHLLESGIERPQLDVRILIGHALRMDRAQLLSQSDRKLDDQEQAAIAGLITRRAKHEPVNRILGHREFWSLDFGVNEATLVPQPESETLIEAALAYYPDRKQNLRILDLGTGSGCLLLALLHELPNATGLGLDRAPRAIEQARDNAERLKLATRAAFRTNNWAEHISERFDIIISNPPYIPQAEIQELMPEVRDHDPRLALDGGHDGLQAYRQLVPQLSRLLKPNGVIVFEFGEGQAEAITTLFQQAGFTKIETHRDLNGIARCVTAFPDT